MLGLDPDEVTEWCAADVPVAMCSSLPQSVTASRRRTSGTLPTPRITWARVTSHPCGVAAAPADDLVVVDEVARWRDELGLDDPAARGLPR